MGKIQIAAWRQFGVCSCNLGGVADRRLCFQGAGVSNGSGGDRRVKRRFMMSSGGCGGLGVGGRCLMLSAVAITLVAVVTIAISRETAAATVAIECM